MTLHLCTHEDREADFVSLKLLVLSLGRHSPAAVLHMAGGALGGHRRDWLAARPNVRLHDDLAPRGGGYDVKPSLLLGLLDRPGIDAVTWLDADILAAHPVEPLLDGLPPGLLVVAEEGFRAWGVGTALRAAAAGHPPGRELGRTVNSCVVRATPAHRGLLLDWQAGLDGAAYRAAQAQDWRRRRIDLLGDQDVLGALLGSAAHADVAVRFLRSGEDITHCHIVTDYGLGPRLRNARRRATPLVHAQGSKLWRQPRVARLRDALSSHRLAALAHRAELAPGEDGWLAQDPPAARALRRLTGDHPSLAGIGFGAYATAKRGYQVLRGRVRAIASPLRPGGRP